jgi:hypothetical protein
VHQGTFRFRRASITVSGEWERIAMIITAAHIQPVVSLIAGILILIVPQILNYIIAIYLILMGLIGLGVLM